MGLDLILRGGMVVLEDGVRTLSIGVEGGKVRVVAEEISGGATEEIDVGGLHVFPGVMDSHVHFNDPGRADWEGVATGSAALVAGGGTVFFDMPLNSSPPTLDGASFDLKKAVCEKDSRADFGLWGGLVPGNLDRMEELAKRGVVGFKAFMSNSGIADFSCCDEWALYRGMEEAARLGLPVAVHAESDAMTGALTAMAKGNGLKGVGDYLESRPVVAELEAVGRALLFAEETGCKLHVVHVSSAKGVETIRRGKSRCDVTCETCPHYLLLCDEDMKRMGPRAKCAPPLRSKKESAALRIAALHGGVDTIGSDHSPAPEGMKISENFFEVWGGVAGVQATLRGLLTLGFPETLIAKLTSGNVARRFGIEGKGGIVEGNDADLAVVDLGVEGEVWREELLDRHRLSPYVGMRMKGAVRRTSVRGRTVFLEGKVVGEAGGNFVRPRRGGAPT